MSKPKSATAVMVRLKEDLGAENPTEVLEKVQALQSMNKVIGKRLADDQGPLSLTLCIDRVTQKYNSTMTGITDLGSLQDMQDTVDHFLREILGPQIQQMEVEAEVQRRLSEEEKKSPPPDNE